MSVCFGRHHEIDYDAGHVYRGDWDAHGKREGFGALSMATDSEFTKYTGQVGSPTPGSLSRPIIR